MHRYDKLWKLPRGERIHAGAFKQHRISAERLQREGVDAKPEVGEFLALVSAALAAGAPGTIQRPATPSSEHHLARPICSTGVRVIAHHACFDVARLNHTAHRHGLRSELRSATLLCTMHSATKHCKLRCKGVPTGFYSVRLWASALNPETPCA